MPDTNPYCSQLGHLWICKRVAGGPSALSPWAGAVMGRAKKLLSAATSGQHNSWSPSGTRLCPAENIKGKVANNSYNIPLRYSLTEWEMSLCSYYTNAP